MANRVFRFSISPAQLSEVRRVVDFDGGATLQDVHDTVRRIFGLEGDHPYAFYLSGKVFDHASEHGTGPSSRNDSRRSRLFRLGLRAGQELAYVFGAKDEVRHSVTVVAVTEADAALGEPVVVESVGEAPREHSVGDNEARSRAGLPEHLADVAPLADTFLALSERLDTLYEEDDARHGTEVDEEEEPEEELEGPPPAIVALLQELAKAALELAAPLEEDDEALHELDEWAGERELLPRLVELPLALVNVGELESALAVARAFIFVAPESFEADVAVILAESGQREEATAQLESNLKRFPDSFVTALKSGEALEALGDPAAAEVSYRRAIELAQDATEREEAVSLLAGFLEDSGRADEIGALAAPVVGRNDPCPCGSGKKYKKCHGA
jgi:hypothetical protein